MASSNVFRSRVDWWLVILLLVVPGWPIATEWANRGGSPPASLWVLIAALAILVVTFVPVRYVIEGKTVSIQCGLIGWEYAAFSVDDVQSVRPTHNPLASPALSLDRLNIDLGFRGNILISPKPKGEFLRVIRTLNPQLHPREHSLFREPDAHES
jgi:hypothetical protein